MYIYDIMVKIATMVSINDDLKKKAKERFWNISDITDRAIREKLGRISIEINEPIVCEFCGKEDRTATKDDLLGLTWLWPDEKWICENCLRHERSAIAMANAKR